MLLLKNSHVWWENANGISKECFRDYITTVTSQIRTCRTPGSRIMVSDTNSSNMVVILHPLITALKTNRCKVCKKNAYKTCDVCKDHPHLHEGLCNLKYHNMLINIETQ